MQILPRVSTINFKSKREEECLIWNITILIYKRPWIYCGLFLWPNSYILKIKGCLRVLIKVSITRTDKWAMQIKRKKIKRVEVRWKILHGTSGLILKITVCKRWKIWKDYCVKICHRSKEWMKYDTWVKMHTGMD